GRCETLAANAKSAADKLGIDYELIKVSKLADLMNRGIMVTPALAIDGEVKITGKVLREDELVKLFKSQSGGV
ncbi:MAG: thioredoxin family protein, partial [Planctomycetota bacterium]